MTSFCQRGQPADQGSYERVTWEPVTAHYAACYLASTEEAGIIEGTRGGVWGSRLQGLLPPISLRATDSCNNFFLPMEQKEIFDIWKKIAICVESGRRCKIVCLEGGERPHHLASAVVGLVKYQKKREIALLSLTVAGWLMVGL